MKSDCSDMIVSGKPIALLIAPKSRLQWPLTLRLAWKLCGRPWWGKTFSYKASFLGLHCKLTSENCFLKQVLSNSSLFGAKKVTFSWEYLSDKKRRQGSKQVVTVGPFFVLSSLTKKLCFLKKGITKNEMMKARKGQNCFNKTTFQPKKKFDSWKLYNSLGCCKIFIQ